MNQKTIRNEHLLIIRMYLIIWDIIEFNFWSRRSLLPAELLYTKPDLTVVPDAQCTFLMLEEIFLQLCSFSRDLFFLHKLEGDISRPLKCFIESHVIHSLQLCNLASSRSLRRCKRLSSRFSVMRGFQYIWTTRPRSRASRKKPRYIFWYKTLWCSL